MLNRLSQIAFVLAVMATAAVAMPIHCAHDGLIHSLPFPANDGCAPGEACCGQSHAELSTTADAYVPAVALPTSDFTAGRTQVTLPAVAMAPSFHPQLSFDSLCKLRI